MYESVTMVNMKFLRQRFFPSKMQEGTSVSQHLDKMEKIIKEFGADMIEELGSSYMGNGISTVIRGRGNV